MRWIFLHYWFNITLRTLMLRLTPIALQEPTGIAALSSCKINDHGVLVNGGLRVAVTYSGCQSANDSTL